ncbi:zinc finger and SCAN domain-containing protein 30-like [Tiliqua scincoides]|uniref:zinc finger and SCAN domain-containing protein 30-like n=1 Tax=Tiliqua scincoides TaxID=71010 RepID=UPI0034626E1B
MNEQTSGGPEGEGRSGEAGRAPGRDQPESVMEPQEDPGRGMQQRWETQWQQFFQTSKAPHPAWGKTQLSEATPWEDAKAFLASFEQVAAACQWPRGEWVAWLLPALSGQAQEAFSLLEARDKEDYGKVKAAILRDEALRRDVQRQHFRQFFCSELEDPRRLYIQVQELCCQWLKPERHTKEQILELLVLEQFLASLPVGIQRWVQAGGPDSCAQAVALLEDFLMSRREAEAETWQEPLQEWAVGLLDAKEEPLDLLQGTIFKEHAEILSDPKQNVEEEASSPGLGIAHPTTLIPPEDQDKGEDELSQTLGIQVEKVINPRKTGAPFHVIEQTPNQSSQRTTFWTVLQEDGENVDSPEGSLAPQHGLVPQPVKKEGTFLPDPVESQKLPIQDSGKELQEPRKSFSQRSNLLRRQVVHTGKKPHQCPECGKSFFRRSHLVSHQLIHTGKKPHRCPECGKNFSRRSSLLRHQQVHTGEKPHKCPDCGKSFSWVSSLVSHQMIHTGTKPHQCPQCEKKFFRRSDLLTHQNIHTGEKPYKCLKCEKSFFRKPSLSSHQNTHTREKLHKCPECEKKFSFRSALLRHQKLHTGVKPHKCPDCGRGFLRRSRLLSHQKMHTEINLTGAG